MPSPRFATSQSRHACHRPARQLHARRFGCASRQVDAVRRRRAAQTWRLQARCATRQLARRSARIGMSFRAASRVRLEVEGADGRRLRPRSHRPLHDGTRAVTAEAYLDYGFAPTTPKDGVPRVEVGGAFMPSSTKASPETRSGRCSTISRSSSIPRTTTSATRKTPASRWSARRCREHARGLPLGA